MSAAMTHHQADGRVMGKGETHTECSFVKQMAVDRVYQIYVMMLAIEYNQGTASKALRVI